MLVVTVTVKSAGELELEETQAAFAIWFNLKFTPLALPVPGALAVPVQRVQLELASDVRASESCV